MASISLCMMVKNESRFLEACLDSARGAVDQILVIDTGSTDGTQGIARAAGAELHEIPWGDSFSAMRNETLDRATGDWVLILDGDEALDDGAAAAIRALDLSADGPAAYTFEVVNYSTDEMREDQANVFRQPRLIRNLSTLRYQGLVHNQLIDSSTGRAPKAEPAQVRVHHFGYLPAIWAEKNKGDRLSLLESAVAAEPERKLARYHLATHLKILERYEEALAEFMLVVDATQLPTDVEYRIMAFVSAAYCAGKLGRHKQSAELCEALLEHEPQFADAHLRRAEALIEMGRGAEVVDDLADLLQDPQRWAIKQSALSFGVPYRLARALFLMNRFADAAPLFEQLGKSGTDDASVFTHLAVSRASLGDREGARAAVERAEALAPDDPDLPHVKAMLESDVGVSATTTAAFRVEVAALLEDGDRAAAMAILQDVLDNEPANAAAHNDLAVILHADGLSDRARDHLLYAADSNPRDLQTLQNLLDVCFDTAHEAEALARVERTLSLTVAGGGEGPRPSDDVPPASTEIEPLRVLIAGAGTEGLDLLLRRHTPHEPVNLPVDATTDDLPEFDLIHVGGPLDGWPDVDWASVLRPGRALLIDEGLLPADLAPGVLRVDASYPPSKLPTRPRVEPVYDGRDIVPVTPAAPLRIYHQAPGGDPGHPDRQTLEIAAAELRFTVELVLDFDPEALARCHAVWRPTTPSLLLTAMALGQAVLVDTTPVEAVVWPERPTMPATRASLEALAEDRSLGDAFRLGRAARRWVLTQHSPARVAAHLSALYAYVRSC
jgi:tetratricopeptide (TPR) repeat protein